MSQNMLQAITGSVIAVLAVITAAVIAIYGMIHGQLLTDVPPWLALLIGAIVGSYFTHNANVNGARQAGVAAAQAAIDAANSAQALTRPVVSNDPNKQ